MLPPTELFKVFTYLPVTDLSVCYLVSSTWRDVSTNLFVQNPQDAFHFVAKVKEYVVLALTTFLANDEQVIRDYHRLRNLKELFDRNISIEERTFLLFPKLNTLAQIIGRLSVYEWIDVKKTILERFKVDLMGGAGSMDDPSGLGVASDVQDDNTLWLNTIHHHVARKQSEMYFQHNINFMDKDGMRQKFQEFTENLVKLADARSRKKVSVLSQMNYYH
jgi:hypothetical protein